MPAEEAAALKWLGWTGPAPVVDLAEAERHSGSALERPCGHDGGVGPAATTVRP